MTAINIAGTSNANNLLLGRGRVYLAPIQTLAGALNSRPGAYRFVGNVPDFKISMNSESLSHKSSQSGLKVTDKQVVISQEATVSFTFEEIDWDNLALFFSGVSAVGLAGDNGARAAFTDAVIYDTGAAEPLPLGRWYDIVNATGVRCYDLNTTGTVIKIGATTLTVTTDYTLNNKLGTVFIESNATTLAAATAGVDLKVTITANATAKLMDEVKSLTTTPVPVACKFISENPTDSDRQAEYQIHKIAFKATGDLGLIGDEFAGGGLEGVMEKNMVADADSPYMTIKSNAAL